MGEAAQCYVARHRYYRASDDKKEINGKDEVSIWGIHDQWLYGTAMVYTVIRCIRGIQASYRDDGHWLSLYELLAGNMPIQDSMPKFMHAMYCLDRNNMYTHVHDIPTNADPTRHGNARGISLIDMRNPMAIKYGFMATERDTGFDGLFKPLSAEEYLRMHYPLDPDSDWRHTRIENPSQKHLRDHRLYVGRTERMISTYVKALSKCNVLTQEDVFQIFGPVSPFVRRLAYRTRRKQQGPIITPIADRPKGRAQRCVAV